MRIALVGDFPLRPERIAGGVEAAFVYLVRGLVALDDLDVHVLTLGQPARDGPAPPPVPGASFHVLPPFPRFELARNFRTYQERIDARLATIAPDVVHAQGATDHAYVALRSGYPTVITVHGVQGEDYKHQPTVLKRARKRLYGALIERYNLRHTRHLIAIGRYVSDYFAPLFRPDVRVHLIPNAVDDAFFRLERRAAGGRILFAGRVNRRKRPLDLVRAFAAVARDVPGAELRLAGDLDGEPATVAELRSSVAAAGLEGRVRLLGSLAEEELRREFAAADLLALSSGQETTPMVIAQAMAVGMPVVATRVGGVAEMVEQGKTGLLVEVGDVDGLADSLRSLLQDRGLATAMGEAARAAALRAYRADVVASRTRDVYRSMLSGTRTGDEIGPGRAARGAA